MREIKFRAWDYNPLLEEPEMYDWKKLDKLDTEGLIHLYDILSGKEKHIIPMQHTGIKDRNGKEIYEGDLLNIGPTLKSFIKSDDFQYANYEIRHDGIDYILYRHDVNLIWGRLSRINDIEWECEVIGNIHENTELINQNQTP